MDDSADMDVDDPHLGVPHSNGKAAQSAKDAHPPQKRYKLTDTIKGLIWQLVCLSNECCRIENEKKCVGTICVLILVLIPLRQLTREQPPDCQ